MIREATVWVRPEREADGFLPEGPRVVTLGGREAVVWVNIQTTLEATSGSLFARYWDTGEVRRFDLSDRPGFFLPTDRPDTLLVGAGKRLLLVNPILDEIEELATLRDDSPRTIINDAEIVPGGQAVVFGTKDLRFADPIAHCYLFPLADRKLTTLADGMTCSNGKVFGPGSTLFDIDTPRKRIDRYTLDTVAGRLRTMGEPLDLSAETGFPDGMVDAGDGTVIVAFYNPEPATFGVAKRFRLADGAVLDEWRTPGSPRVTCPLLVRRREEWSLVLTTATEGMPTEQRMDCPNAGSLFISSAGELSPPAAEVVKLSDGPKPDRQ